MNGWIDGWIDRPGGRGFLFAKEEEEEEGKRKQVENEGGRRGNGWE